jgi:hypothetical protein
MSLSNRRLYTVHLFLLTTVLNCGFSGRAATDSSPSGGDDGATSIVDARLIDAMPSPYKITHLAEADRRVGTIDMVISDAVIDTGMMQITSAGTAYVIPADDFKIVTQVGGAGGLAGQVAVLYVHSFQLGYVVSEVVNTVTIEHNLRVVGTLPLIIVSATDIILDDTIDANGRDGIAGPGGHPAFSTQPTLLGDGHEGTEIHAGGGGGGSAIAGASGGSGDNGDTSGGNGGDADNANQTLLLGGGAGGPSTIACSGLEHVGGPGGGGLQLFAVNKIELTARSVITVGGGGGKEGRKCTTTTFTGGAGGGAGGILFLEAPEIVLPNKSVLASNGGGGGEGAEDADKPGLNGARGTKTALPASGGSSNNGGDGGNGAAGTTAPQRGFNAIAAGGGGGAVGLIYLHGNVNSNGIISPAAKFIP